MEPPRVLLIDDGIDVARLPGAAPGPYRAVLCLFWAAPSTLGRLGRAYEAPCLGLGDIVGPEARWGEDAMALVTPVVAGGPSHRGFPWRAYLEERLYREGEALSCVVLARAFATVERLAAGWDSGGVEVHGLLTRYGRNLIGGALVAHPALRWRSLPTRGAATADPPGSRRPLALRAADRFREAWITGDWAGQAWELAEWADKALLARGLAARLMPPPGEPSGGITFFSSYANNTRTLAPYARLMPRPVHWVVGNRSATLGLPEGASWSPLWRHAARHRVRIPEDRVAPRGCDPLSRAWLESTRVWREWGEVELPLLARLSAAWESHLATALPRLVVMASQWGIEGWFTRLARNLGVPVLQVLHGLTLWRRLYQGTPILSDGLVVWGPFWRDLWPETQRRRIVCFNPRPVQVPKPVSGGPRRLAFFSWAIRQDMQYHSFSELMDGFIGIFDRLLRGGRCHVIYRPHPRENPRDFLGRWRSIAGPVPEGLEVSKREGIESVLSRVDCALMFHSTALVECLPRGIPVVLPGWIDFGWNSDLAGLRGLSLPPDLPDLGEAVASGLERGPAPGGRGLDAFLSPPGQGERELRELVGGLISRAGAGLG